MTAGLTALVVACVLFAWGQARVDEDPRRAMQRAGWAATVAAVVLFVGAFVLVAR